MIIDAEPINHIDAIDAINSIDMSFMLISLRMSSQLLDFHWLDNPLNSVTATAAALATLPSLLYNTKWCC
jgi:hypothetical protein